MASRAAKEAKAAESSGKNMKQIGNGPEGDGKRESQSAAGLVDKPTRQRERNGVDEEKGAHRQSIVTVSEAEFLANLRRQH